MILKPLENQQPRRQTSCRLRNSNYALHHWGSESPAAPQLILLHGFLDCGATWQLMVDELLPALNQSSGQNWAITAPDWRGFGDSSWNEQHYWFADYLADLDALLAILPDAATKVVAGHSMGANIAALYAGARPDRLTGLALLEGFGLPDSDAATAPARMTRWLDDLLKPPQARVYESRAVLVASMQKYNPRLSDTVADFIARCWSNEAVDGRVTLKADPRHRMRGPILYRRAEALSFWADIAVPTLWLEGAETDFSTFYEQHDLDERKAAIRGMQQSIIDDAGHMLHHEQPAAVAAALRRFICELQLSP